MYSNRIRRLFRFVAWLFIALASITFLNLTSAGAQTRIVKSKIYGSKDLDFANSVDRLADGTFVVGGWTGRSVDTESSSWVLWLDSDLNLIRELVIDGPRHREMKVTGIAGLEDGGVIASGWETYGASRLSRGFVFRLNAKGTLVWKRTVDGGQNARAVHMTRTRNGDVVVSGWYREGAWVFRMTDAGEIVWNKTFEKFSTARSVHTSDSGEFVIGGDISKKVCCDTHPSIFGLDSSGNLVWEHSFENLGRGTLNSVKHLPDGGYLAVGSLLRKGAFEGDGILLRLDNNRDLLWSKKFGLADRDFAINDFETTPDGGFFLIANQDSSIGWLLRVDRTGTREWSKRIDLVRPAALFDTLRLSPRRVFVVGAGTNEASQRTDGVLFFVQE